MRTLLLLRHAKSSWENLRLVDFDRPLSKRGQKAAPRMAALVAARRLNPDLVLCSTAVRTRLTLDLVLPALGQPPPEVVYEDGLYLAETSDILARIHSLPDDRARVMLIGHNPGLHGTALALAGIGDRTDLAALAVNLPTAGLAVLDFDAARWSDIRPASGRLALFATPRTLGDDDD